MKVNKVNFLSKMKRLTAGLLVCTLSLFTIHYSLFAKPTDMPGQMIYTVQPGAATVGANDKDSYARSHRFYVGADLNYSMWENMIDRPLLLNGRHDFTFDAMAGVRIYDWLRAEANYYRLRTDLAGDRLYITGNAAFLNLIVDARLSSLYRFMSHQWFVPYVGVGAGVSFNTLNTDSPWLDAKMECKAPFIWAAMAGVAIEFNEWFALDFGYRYMYMASPHVHATVSVLDYELDDLSPVSHQLRAGVRISF